MSINLPALDSTAGFKIIGENAYDYDGHSVSSAGDVNGYGYRLNQSRRKRKTPQST